MKKTTSRLWALLFALLALAALCAVSASAEIVGGDCGSSATWSYDTDTHALTISGSGEMSGNHPWKSEYQNEIQTVEIQNGVTSITSDAFYNCTAITEVNFPESLLIIGAGAFAGCSSLQSVTLPDNLVELGEMAFWNCAALESISLPDDLRIIGLAAFGNNPALEEITIPAGVTNAVGLFGGTMVSGLQRVTIEEGFRDIGTLMFAYTQLEDIVIPSSVESIGALAFSLYCPNINTIRIGNGLREIRAAAANGEMINAIAGAAVSKNPETVYTCMTEEEWNANVTIQTTVSSEEAAMIGVSDPTSLPPINWISENTELVFNSHIPDDDGILCALCGRQLIETSGSCGTNTRWSYDTETKVLTISGTGEMSSRPWRENFKDDIQTVVIQNGVTNIVHEAFHYCTALESVSIPESVTGIEFYAFRGCTALESVVLPEGLTEIGIGAFDQCHSLESINIPSGIRELPDWALCDCPALQEITLPEGLETIGSVTFTLSGLEELTIPDSVRTINALSLIGTELKTIQIGTQLESVGYCAFNTDIAPLFGLGEAKLETIRICMTQEEWENQVEEIPMTQEEMLRLTGMEVAEIPEMSIFPSNVEVLFDSHVPGDPVMENLTAATCTASGHYETATYCTVCGKELSRNSSEEDRLGHNLNLTWIWSDDGSFATVEGACSRCETVVAMQQADVTREEQEDGSILCTARITVDGQIFFSTLLLPAPSAHTHTFTASWVWSDDGTMANLDLVCSDCSETITIRPTVSRETLSDGKIRCTASVTYDGQTYTDSKVVEPASTTPTPVPTPTKFRCSMCKLNDAYKGKGFIGKIISLVHSFVHLVSQIGR